MIISNINNQTAIHNKHITPPDKEIVSQETKDNVSFSSKEEIPFYKNSPALQLNSAEKTSATNTPDKLANLAEEITLKTASDLVPSQGSVALKLLYTNDIHGAILPFEKEDKPGVQYGGISMLANLMNEKTIDGATIKIDGGDWAQGTYPSGRDKGITMMKLLSTLKYDATIIGNHDFDWGRDNLGKMMEATDFPVLGANIIDSEKNDLMNGVKPYVIKEMNGVKVGIIGVTSSRTADQTAPANTVGLSFADPVKTIKKYLPEMEKQDAEMIVVVSHCGDEFDQQIAKGVPEIDVIVGAHSHKALEDPILVGKTLILQAGSSARNLGELDITFDKAQDKIVDFRNDLVYVNSNTSKPDPKIESMLAPVMDEIMEKLNEPAGTTDILLSRRGANAETIMGNIVADSLKKAGNAEVAFTDQGGIRADIRPGEITYGEIYQVFPAENSVVTMDLTGAQLKSIMEESARRTRGTIEVSGMKMDIEPKNGKDEKVMNIMVNGEPLDLKRTYRVATNDYLSAGGNGYGELTKGKNTNSEGVLVRDALFTHIKETGTFNETNAKLEGRQNYLSPKPSWPKKFDTSQINEMARLNLESKAQLMNDKAKYLVEELRYIQDEERYIEEEIRYIDE